MACGHVSSLDVRWAGKSCLPLYFELLHWPNALKALLQVGCTLQMGVAAGPCQQAALGFLWSRRNRHCSECSLVDPGGVLGASHGTGSLWCWHDPWAVESSQELLPNLTTNPQTLCLLFACCVSRAHCSFHLSVTVYKWRLNVFIFKQWHGAGWAGHYHQQEWGPESFA